MSEEFARKTVQLLAQHLHTDIPDKDVSHRKRVDLVVQALGQRFVLEIKSTSSPAVVAKAVHQLRHNTQPTDIPVVVVPYMTEGGRTICHQEGCSWMDLSGNADIVGERLLVRIEGKPNKFKQPGRPASLFSPKSARITRVLLSDVSRIWQQADILQQSDVSPALVSRVVKQMRKQGYLEELEDKAYKVTRPDQLLLAWTEAYDFSKHTIIKGHIHARTGEELVSKLASGCQSIQIEYTATGLAAAWLHAPFANYRLCSVYLHETPGANDLAQLGFTESTRGANTWLIVPNDIGVLYQRQQIHGINVVSPLQAYMDLQTKIERSDEAAEHLAGKKLPWITHD